MSESKDLLKKSPLDLLREIREVCGDEAASRAIKLHLKNMKDGKPAVDQADALLIFLCFEAPEPLVAQ